MDHHHLITYSHNDIAKNAHVALNDNHSLWNLSVIIVQRIYWKIKLAGNMSISNMANVHATYEVVSFGVH